MTDIRSRLYPLGNVNILKPASQVVCGIMVTWYLTTSGDLYGCGNNNYGQQGSGDTTDVLTFTKRN